jgi:indolepyruvate ferredoxin oxidoreductase
MTAAQRPQAATGAPPTAGTSPLDQRSGRLFLTGNQALVRLPFEVRWRDDAAGSRTNVFISGYPGSPLAGYDLALERIRDRLNPAGIVHVPAGNEELAVAACTGTQMLDDYPHDEVEGVVAMWYGKGPGIDRSGDALKHGNFAGTSRLGAVVVLMGDDHEAKSSTMPFQSEFAMRAAGIPVLAPADVTDILTLGLHAVAMSRHSGCWVGLKLTNSLCDGGRTVDLDELDDAARVVPPGGSFAKRTDFSFYPGKNIEQERHLHEDRIPQAQAYARSNRLDRIGVATDHDRIGIVAAGKSWTDVRQALADLHLTDDDLRAAGVRTLKLALVSPVDPETIRSFADGLEEILVIEEKAGFIEEQIRSCVQPLGRPLRVVGKHDDAGATLFPVHGGFGADVITRVLASRLADRVPMLTSNPRVKELEVIDDRLRPAPARRTPNFCSGCPHSASTVKGAEQQAWGAPGCGGFCTVIEQPERHIDTMTHYGGEGLGWIGLSRFTTQPHLIQHVGDGSFYHSSHLNIRWAVATGTRMTFKILYNGTVANTGAQNAEGQRGVAALTRLLEAEGVARCVIATKQPRRYRRRDLGRGTEVRRARDMLDVTRELAEVDGVTVMIYDESCANERRRLRKRGLAPPPESYVVVNPDVCENCGDCGVKSNCMSLQKTATEFGPKVRVHQSSCNQDLSCVQGDCPSFVTVKAGGLRRRAVSVPALTAQDLPDAAVPEPPTFRMVAPGVGGTGVLTMNALLATAADLEGRQVLTYDQTGAAQKWGAVVSMLAVGTTTSPARSNIVGAGQADLLLALDEVSSSSADNQRLCSPDRTRLVLNTDLFPTSEMVRDVRATVDTERTRGLLRSSCRADSVEVPARQIAEELFGDYMMTNVVAIGAAWQSGALPIGHRAIERAIEINGVAVDRNLQAFRYGRLWIVDPDRVRRLINPPPTTAEEEFSRRRSALGRRGGAYARLVESCAGWGEPLHRVLAVRLAELIDFQGVAYASRYLAVVARVRDREQTATSGEEVTTAVARNLFKVYAYKDEYEVARLHLRGTFRAHVGETFADVRRLTFHLAPPALRRFGAGGKVAVPGWIAWPVFGLLRSLRVLRGTPWDPFGRQHSRRLEREVRDWYEELIGEVLPRLSPLTTPMLLELATLPDDIRGYEELKERSFVAAQERGNRLASRLDRPGLPLIPS